MVGEQTNSIIGISSIHTSDTDTPLLMEWGYADGSRICIKDQSSSGLCSLWYRLDRNPCNHCCGCVIRKQIKEEGW